MRRIRMGRLYLLLRLILLEACSSVDQVFAEATMPFSAGPTVLTVEREKHLGHTAGSEFRECAIACPIMVIIPAGKHTIGSPEDEGGRTKGERVAAAACSLVIDAWGRKNMPVINVSWGDAKLFVAWLSRLTGKEYRLLTEAEWEYAARAGSNTRYSWGDEPGIGRANCSGCGGAWTLQTAPVGSFRPNAFGLHDMEGNVWEWVDDIWHDSHEGTPANGAAELQDGDPTYRVIRGGSWHNETELVRPAIRFKRHSKVQFDTLGLRVGRTIGP
jgi:hypothetical protein